MTLKWFVNIMIYCQHIIGQKMKIKINANVFSSSLSFIIEYLNVLFNMDIWIFDLDLSQTCRVIRYFGHRHRGADHIIVIVRPFFRTKIAIRGLTYTHVNRVRCRTRTKLKWSHVTAMLVGDYPLLIQLFHYAFRNFFCASSCSS